MICIYGIKSPNNKWYIGQTINLEKRVKDYRNFKNIKSQVRLNNSFKKYGFQNHTIHILKECNDKNELNFWEKFYIKLFDTFETEHGLNLTTGGGCGYTVSDETKERLRKINIGKKQSEETKQKKREISLRLGIKPPIIEWTDEKRKKWSESFFGEKNGNYGKEMKPHVKEKLLKANLNKRLSEERKIKISGLIKNKSKSQEHRNKISAANKGLKRRKYKIICIDNGMIFNTLKDAAKYENRGVTIVRDMILGRRENITKLRIYA